MKKLLPLLLLLAGIASAQTVNTTIQPKSMRYDYDMTVTDSTATEIHVHHIIPEDYISYGDYSNRCDGLSRLHTQDGANPTQTNLNPGTKVTDIYTCTASDGTLWFLRLDGILYYYKGRGGRACGGCGVYIQVQSGSFTEETK